MKVTLIQTDTIWNDVSANLKMVDSMMSEADTDSDLVVLPEMFNTGFSMTPEVFSEREMKETIDQISVWSKAANAIICGSMIRKHDQAYYNSFFWSEPNGKVAFYNKRHLFNIAGEGEHYKAGTARKVFHCGTVKIMPQICYDLRFPVFARNDLDYDCLIYVANWPLPRIEAWNTLLKARAIENQCYVIGVNRVGKDANENQYSGQSVIIDYTGRILYNAHDNISVGGTAIDLQSMYTFREKLPFLKDRDQFSINF